MQVTRREFVNGSVLSAVAAVAGSRGTSSRGSSQESGRRLRILILGGTSFLGPHQVRAALQRGHHLTLFNRGKTNPHLFPEVEKLRGDRNDDLESLRGKTWDVVIDNSASIPRWVRQSAELLKGNVEHYLYVSSISVYSDNSIIGITESSPVGTLKDPSVEEITGETFGPLKALSEKEAEKAFPGRTTVIRPGLIVGPEDPSDRFTYWPVRIDSGGEVLSPGNPTDPVQFIDVRDLAAWMIHMVEQPSYGAYNATGPRTQLSMAEMLYGIRAVTSSEVSFTWVPADFLEKQEVQPWSHMPVWVPPVEGMQGFSRVNCDRAIGLGLQFRPLADTATATLQWFRDTRGGNRSDLKSGLGANREKEVLAAWHSREKD